MPYTLKYNLINDGAAQEVTGYTGEPVNVVIPKEYDGLPVASISSAFLNCKSLKSVEIPDSVTSIGVGAFQGCKKLKSVEIPDGVTSIGFLAFYNCSSLTSITIPFVGATKDGTSNTHFGYIFGARSYDYNNNSIPKSLKKVTITGGNIEDKAFYNCSSLTSISISDSVMSISDTAFYYCSSLTNITVDTNNTVYKSIDGNLYSKDGKMLIQYAIGKTATSFTIPNSVTSIGNYAFNDCDSLTNVVIPDSVTSIGDFAFYQCSSLTSVTIPDSVTSIGDATFSTCSSLTNVVIGNSVTSICDATFSNCSSLTEMTLPFVGKSKSATGYESVFGYIFGYTTRPSDTIISGATYQYSSGSIYYYYYIPASLKKVTVTGGPIGDQAFYNCSSLTNVVIGNSVTSIGFLAFYNCSGLTELTIPFVGAKAGVTASNTYQYPFGYIFGTNSYTGGTAATQKHYGDSTSSITSTTYYIPSGLRKVTVTGGNILHGAFNNCSSLTSITIPEGITSIGESAFAGCTSLINITIPNSVTSIGMSAFYECKSLLNVTIPNGVESIVWGSFFGCTSLTRITIPDSVRSIGDSAFRGCSSLTSITIPDSVKSIGWGPFYDCSNLTSVTIGNGVRDIGDSAFNGCYSLKSVTIPDSVRSISSSAFDNCRRLTSVTLLSREPANVGSRLFSSNPTFYCFSEAIEKYKKATDWKTYVDNFKADDMRLYFTMNAVASKAFLISKAELESIVSNSSSFDDFKSKISELL